MSNYRIMRYRQRFWAVMDCDEKGRPKTMKPIFYHRDLKLVRNEMEKLETPEAEAENKPVNKKRQKVDEE